MNVYLKAAEFGGIILNSLVPGAVWRWMTGRGQSRAGTFFGARVEAGFAESCSGQAILSQFRQRLWVWSLGGMTACMVAIASDPVTLGVFSKVVFAAASLTRDFGGHGGVCLGSSPNSAGGSRAG
jgi:hypothetical protein